MLICKSDEDLRNLPTVREDVDVSDFQTYEEALEAGELPTLSQEEIEEMERSIREIEEEMGVSDGFFDFDNSPSVVPYYNVEFDINERGAFRSVIYKGKRYINRKTVKALTVFRKVTQH